MKSAFTMIELVFVIVIIGILSAVALPSFMDNRDSANSANEITELRTSKTEIMSYVLLNNTVENLPTNNLECFEIEVSTTKLLTVVSSESSESYCVEAITKAGLISLMDSIQL